MFQFLWLAIERYIYIYAILAEVCQPAGFEFIGLLICGLRSCPTMKLLLILVGPRDEVIEWMDTSR